GGDSARRQYADHAVGARLFLLDATARMATKTRGGLPGSAAGTTPDQGTDFRALCEPDIPWPAGQFFHLWLRRGGQRLFQRGRRQPDVTPSGLFGGADPRPQYVFALPAGGSSLGAAQLRDQADARTWHGHLQAGRESL